MWLLILVGCADCDCEALCCGVYCWFVVGCLFCVGLVIVSDLFVLGCCVDSGFGCGDCGWCDFWLLMVVSSGNLWFWYCSLCFVFSVIWVLVFGLSL